MRHYCNRQDRKSVSCRNDFKEKGNETYIGSRADKNTDEAAEEVVFPPGCGYDYVKSPDIEYKVYGEQNEGGYGEGQGGAFSQSSTYNKQESVDIKNDEMQREAASETRLAAADINTTRGILADNMSGSFGIMSVPKLPPERQLMSMPIYLDRYRGKYICLDLWTYERRRIEKCGVLTEVGTDFLSIKNPHTGDIVMIDLRTVRYISIYCR